MNIPPIFTPEFICRTWHVVSKLCCCNMPIRKETISSSSTLIVLSFCIVRPIPPEEIFFTTHDFSSSIGLCIFLYDPTISNCLRYDFLYSRLTTKECEHGQATSKTCCLNLMSAEKTVLTLLHARHWIVIFL